MMGRTIPSQGLDRYRKSKALRNAKLALDPTCRICGQTKTVNDFPREAVDYSCNACRRIMARNDFRKKMAAMSPQEYRAWRDQTNRKQNANRRKMLSAMSKETLSAYKDRINAGNVARRKAVRDEVYRAYGGYKCNCCGETEPKFLSIDHVNNDGAKHKREHRLHTGEQMYRWLKRHGFPPGFQILCMNCQWGKRNNNGVCPHTSKV